jgi:hypothetical protein
MEGAGCSLFIADNNLDGKINPSQCANVANLDGDVLPSGKQ